MIRKNLVKIDREKLSGYSYSELLDIAECYVSMNMCDSALIPDDAVHSYIGDSRTTYKALVKTVPTAESLICFIFDMMDMAGQISMALYMIKLKEKDMSNEF